MNKTIWLVLGVVAALALIRRQAQRLSGLSGDVSSDEDLAQAAMNLCSLEEHALRSFQETNDPAYLEQMRQARRMRRDLMRRLGCGGRGQDWCAAKHLLSATMRLQETANKADAGGDSATAQDLYGKAKNCYDMFWRTTGRRGQCPCNAER